ncbi:MAG: radical SAM protein [Desulfobacterales bacterium]|nr:radical SAM protein [Desulfobacterales bacterium]MBF0397552.1 radical SAM protein [Desulfobacterales bacterium]
MKILLISVPVLEGVLSDSPPSIGLAYIASALIKKEYNVSVLDINGCGYNFDDVENILKDYEFDFVGISGLVTQYSYIKKLTCLIKLLHPDKKIIIGGYIGSTVSKLLLTKTLADIVVIGEGEITIVELIKALQENADISTIAGLAFKKNSEIIFTKPRELIANIDLISFPAWDLFQISSFFSNSKERAMPILTSRGCPFHCIFCYDSFGKKMRFRSPENIIAEIKELKSKYNITKLHFYDETFTVNRERAKEICNMLIQEDLDIKWECTGRVNCIDEELLEIMKEAGLISILYGIESGSQRVLDEMNKGVTVEQASKAVRLTKKIGINMSTPLMMGSPCESEETIEESIRFFTKENIYGHIVFQTPYPGAQLWDYALEKGLIKDEEKYIENSGSFSVLHVNLTDMSDQRLLEFKHYAEKKIFWSFFIKNLPQIISKIVIQGKKEGYKSILANITLIVKMIRQFIR